MAVTSTLFSPFVSKWMQFFEETQKFGEASDGVANAGYTEHTIETLEFCISTCNGLH